MFPIDVGPAGTHDCAALHATQSNSPPISDVEKAAMISEARTIKRTWTGQPLQWPADYKVIAQRFVIPDANPLPEHHHPYPRFARVLEGYLRVVQVGTGEERVFRPGEMIAESVLQRHYGIKVGGDRVVLNLLDVVPTDWQEGNTVYDPLQ
jgi:quercetin dioxygenase-like cupin family protein